MNLLGAVVLAEIRKLLSRPLVRFALILLAGVGAFGPFALWMLSGSGITLNGGDLGASLDVSAQNGVRWSLLLRNYFFVAQVLLAVLATVSYAGEFQSHTLREDLVRPVPRAVVLLAKWAALAAWSLLSLIIQGVVAIGVGLLIHPAASEVTWANLGLGMLATWVAEVSFAALALAAAVVLRSVAGTLLGVFLVLLFERFVTWGLTAARSVSLSMSDTGSPAAFFEILPFTPTSAWSVWSELVTGTDPSWQPWVALVGWTALAVVIAERVFSRTDVP